eukprot:14383934-Ditylum_brightwellii.AAC.1
MGPILLLRRIQYILKKARAYPQESSNIGKVRSVESFMITVLRTFAFVRGCPFRQVSFGKQPSTHLSKVFTLELQ